MSDNKRTLRINPQLFKLNGGKKKDRSMRRVNRTRPIVDAESSSNANKVKKEMLKRVKDYQKNKEQEKIREDKMSDKFKNNNLFERNEFENSEFEREFNKSLNFLSDLAKKNKERKRNKQTLKNPAPNIQVNLSLPNNLDERNDTGSIQEGPSYGCLKNGSKPTYSQLNKTQKSRDINKPKIQIVLENNVYDDGPKPFIEKPKAEERAKSDERTKVEIKEEMPENLINFERPLKELQNLAEKVDIKNTINALSKPINETQNPPVQMNPPTIQEVDTQQITEVIKKNDDLKLKNIPKINRLTKTFKYRLGKMRDKNCVGIFIKNRETQKRIKHELSIIKNKPLQEIKNNLREKNLIKVGTDAPSDVLRKLYEDSILAGEVVNTNNNNMLHNYLTGSNNEL
jgi:hypothetical protein